MDTKLKRYNPVLKGLAFTLIIVFGCMFTLLFIKNMDGLSRLQNIRDLTEKDITKTVTVSNERDWVYNQIQNIITLSNDDKIEKAVKENIAKMKEYEFEGAKEQLINQYLAEGHSVSELTDQKIWELFVNQTKLKYDSQYALEFHRLRESYLSSLKFLDVYDIYIYRIVTDGKVISNTTKDFKQIKKEYRYVENIDPSAFGITESENSFFAFKDSYLDKVSTEFDDLSHGIAIGVPYILIILISLSYLTFAAGRKDSEPSQIYHLFVDKIYNEVTLGFLFLSIYGIALCFIGIFENVFGKPIMLVLLGGSIASLIEFYLILVRHFKSRTLIKNTIIFKFLHKICHGFNKVYNLGSPLTKIFIAIVSLGILTMIPFVGFVTVPIIMWLMYRQMKHYLKVKKGIQDIRSGMYREPILIDGDGEFSQLASNLNAIASGIEDEVERRMKSERLKTELIVNVSHDIRTPLTSLVTYVDLLKKEPTNSDEAKKYLEVIDQKTERLKVLIDDLFEAAKASSGNVNVNFEKVDVVALLTQGMAELEEKILESTLDFKIQVPDYKVFAKADGKLLWRVVNNLLSNVLKYSLNHSRVYIRIIDEADKAIIEIKNISSTELNIAEDEIMERFIRGDKSRLSEGSGLGLDIAKSLMACQNGSLSIKIDGDLFKASVCIPKFES